MLKNGPQIHLNRSDLLKIIDFFETYDDCENFTLHGSNESGIGQTLHILTNYQVDPEYEYIVDNKFRDITDYDKW